MVGVVDVEGVERRGVVVAVVAVVERDVSDVGVLAVDVVVVAVGAVVVVCRQVVGTVRTVVVVVVGGVVEEGIGELHMRPVVAVGVREVVVLVHTPAEREEGERGRGQTGRGERN